MSPVLVTGATGFMGRHLVSRLLADGRAVRVLERRPSDAFDGLAVERVTGDVTQPETLVAACAGAESVFNLAGVLSHSGHSYAGRSPAVVLIPLILVNRHRSSQTVGGLRLEVGGVPENAGIKPHTSKGSRSLQARSLSLQGWGLIDLLLRAFPRFPIWI